MGFKVGEIYDIYKQHAGNSCHEDEFTVRYNKAKKEFLQRTESMVKQYTGTIEDFPDDVYKILDIINIDDNDYRMFPVYGKEPDGRIKGLEYVSMLPLYMYVDTGVSIDFYDELWNELATTTNIRMVYVSSGIPIKRVDGA